MLLSLLSKRTLRADFRDAYGFTVRPQYLETFKEFEPIYRNEEEERSTKWEIFLEQHEELARKNSSVSDSIHESGPDAEVVTDNKTDSAEEPSGEGGDAVLSDEKPTLADDDNNNNNNNIQTESVPENVVVPETPKPKKPAVRNWAEVRSSLNGIENVMCQRVKNRKNKKNESLQKHLEPIQEAEPSTDEVTDNEEPSSTGETSDEVVVDEYSFPWKEVESLVLGGVPRDLRGEAWQAFVGVKARRVESYYQNLLDVVDADGDSGATGDRASVPEKCRKQIEKDLPRTFPGHPALNEEGRNSLRRLLLAYAQHNPDVGYCQAMNFFAAMLLLMMPEENAFWTLVGMMEDYFDGYFNTDMIESQVDQLVFEDLMRERYPKLVNHFDHLGVEMGWICGPWFLSIFVNMIPWESVLRVWDVILFEGNRAMLLRTALALMELYGPDLGTAMDAGDAITLMQSLVGSTFDSSNLVLNASVSFSYVTEDILQNSREKHRPDVIAAVKERMKGEHVRRSSKGLATKLYSFKKEREPPIRELSIKRGFGDKNLDKDVLDLMSPLKPDESLKFDPFAAEVDSLPDIQDQVIWLKAQLCSMLEDKRSATIRAEELETALMEMAQQDNRRELSARLEHMEQEVSELHQLLSDKKEQEKAMLEVLMRVEQEQKITEDARRNAERDAAAQRYLVSVLEEKYEQAMTSVIQWEKRALMAESMVEATLQYDSSQVKAQEKPSITSTLLPTPAPTPAPGNIRAESARDNNNSNTRRPGLLSFGLGWRDKNKGKPTNEASGTSNDYQDTEK